MRCTEVNHTDFIVPGLARTLLPGALSDTYSGGAVVVGALALLSEDL